MQGDVDLDSIKYSISENNLSRAEKDIFKGASIVFVGVIVSKLLMSIIHLIIARKLGVIDYGLFSLSYSLIAIIGGVLTFGFPPSLARFVP
ncbi:MAG: oligosaccharide flippase family protein, partial [Dehalococcoidales bacterium]|nr:oligosaccharide flippase family protein [Dehalococcoidales bacterium]